VAEEVVEVETEEVVVEEGIIRIKTNAEEVKTITKIDKDHITTTAEDNNNQECLMYHNHWFKLNSSSQLLSKCKSLTCNQSISLLSLLCKDLQETNSSETVFTAISKPLSVTNMLQELLVCFWTTMPELTSNNF
jgi:hypothetical protein